jgi:putative hydrolase
MSIPFGFNLGDGKDPNEALAAMFEGLGKALRNSGSNSGAFSEQTTKEAAQNELRKLGDPTIDDRSSDALRAAHNLACLWIATATDIGPNEIDIALLTRSQWLDRTFNSWSEIARPVAEGVSAAASTLIPSDDENLMAMVGPMMDMARNMGATMFGMQFGTALAGIAKEVLSGSDVGIPLEVDTTACYLPANINAFSPEEKLRDAILYIALREVAHVRLFAQASWLRPAILTALSNYSHGVKVDHARIEEIMGSIDPTNPDAISDLMASGVLEPELTAEQKQALERLETLLALIEGWVSVVVANAAAGRLGELAANEETFRRRRGAGGPAERVFNGLVGLELRPRKIREAIALWQNLTETIGSDARDEKWSHPDLLPAIDEQAAESTDSSFIDEIENFLRDQ